MFVLTITQHALVSLSRTTERAILIMVLRHFDKGSTSFSFSPWQVTYQLRADRRLLCFTFGRRRGTFTTIARVLCFKLESVLWENIWDRTWDDQSFVVLEEICNVVLW